MRVRVACVVMFLGAACSSFSAVDPEPVGPDAGGTTTMLDGGSDAATEAAVDAAGLPIPIDIERWSSPNGAGTFRSAEGYISITTKGSTNHPVITPVALPDFGADDYTLYATVITATSGEQQGFEFGFVVRLTMNPVDVGYVFGSTYGNSGNPFIAQISPSNWEPANVNQATPTPIGTGLHYNVKVKAEGGTLFGKGWPADTAEPGWQVTYPNVRATGRGVGFYTYYINNTAVVSLAYTVP